MTDRESLLAAIRLHPDEDTPRLVYADWLEEHGSGDLDRATVEFVRLACDMRPGGRGRKFAGPSMARAAYPWLRANWRRLIPTAAALCVPWMKGLEDPANPDDAPRAERFTGRWVHAAWRLYGQSRWLGDVSLLAYAVRLSFCRGFCDRVLMWSPMSRKVLGPALRADQPLLRPTDGVGPGVAVGAGRPASDAASAAVTNGSASSQRM